MKIHTLQSEVWVPRRGEAVRTRDAHEDLVVRCPAERGVTRENGRFTPPVRDSQARTPVFPLFSYAALLPPFPSRARSLPTLTFICFGFASAFFASLIFNTPLS